jgi:hypothetical protein
VRSSWIDRTRPALNLTKPPESSLDGFSVLALSYDVQRGRDIYVAFVPSTSAVYRHGTARSFSDDIESRIPLLSEPVQLW